MRYFFFLIGLFFFFQIHANEKVQVYGSRHGLVVMLGKPLPVGHYYRIERASQNSDSFEMLNVVSGPGSFQQFRAIADLSVPMFYDFHLDSVLMKKAYDDLQQAIAKGGSGYFTIHPALQLASGMIYLDTAIKSGISYTYRVSEISGNKVDQIRFSNPQKTGMNAELRQPVLKEVKLNGKSIATVWQIAGNPKPSSFEIQRRIIGKTDFEIALVQMGFRGKKDTMELMISDTLIAPDENYEYRLTPLDFWGNPGVSQLARVSNTSSSNLPYVYDLSAKGDGKQKGIKLCWKKSNYPFLRSLSILRSEKFDGEYKTIASLPAADSVYFDQTIDPHKTYFYRVVVNTLNKETYPSGIVMAMWMQQDKPLPPQNFSVLSSEGKVRLSWTTLEKDLWGCLVFRGVSRYGRLEQVSQVVLPGNGQSYSWIDSSLTPQDGNVFVYSVVALNKANISGVFSDTLRVTHFSIPSFIPAPSRLHVNTQEKSLLLTWDDMRQQDPGIVTYRVFRRYGEEDWILLNKEGLPYGVNYFTDSTLQHGKVYEYKIESVHVSGGLSAASLPVKGSLSESKPSSPVIASVYSTEQGLLIRWGQVMDPTVKTFRVYRRNEEGKVELLAEVAANLLEYTDTKAPKEKFLVYYVVSVNETGTEGEPNGEMGARR